MTVLLVAALVSDVSALPLNNCTAHYQAALEEVLTIKKQCKGAAFYDCCQVRSTELQEQIGSIDLSGTESISVTATCTYTSSNF